jgi:hypothetical protein
MMKRRKLIIFISSILFFLVLYDFYPFIYYNMINRSEDFYIRPTDYVYENVSSNNLLKSINKLDKRSVIVCKLDQSKVVFYDTEEMKYYHSVITQDVIDSKVVTQLLFCYVSNTISTDNARRVNKDYDRVINYFEVSRFENLIIKNLKEVTLTYSCIPRWKVDAFFWEPYS